MDGRAKEALTARLYADRSKASISTLNNPSAPAASHDGQSPLRPMRLTPSQKPALDPLAAGGIAVSKSLPLLRPNASKLLAGSVSVSSLNNNQKVGVYLSLLYESTIINNINAFM